jgi:hypothetical protein
MTSGEIQRVAGLTPEVLDAALRDSAEASGFRVGGLTAEDRRIDRQNKEREELLKGHHDRMGGPEAS